MQIPARKVMSWQENLRQKVVGLNPGAGFFAHEISVKLHLYDHLAVKFVHVTLEKCRMHLLSRVYVWQIHPDI